MKTYTCYCIGSDGSEVAGISRVPISMKNGKLLLSDLRRY